MQEEHGWFRPADDAVKRAAVYIDAQPREAAALRFNGRRLNPSNCITVRNGRKLGGVQIDHSIQIPVPQSATVCRRYRSRQLRRPLRLTQLRDDLADAALDICARRFARVGFRPNPPSAIIIDAGARFRATRGWDVLVIIAYGADDCARPGELQCQDISRTRYRRINR